MQFESLLHTTANSEKVWTTTVLKSIIPSEVSAGIENGIYLSANRINIIGMKIFSHFSQVLYSVVLETILYIFIVRVL